MREREREREGGGCRDRKRTSEKHRQIGEKLHIKKYKERNNKTN